MNAVLGQIYDKPTHDHRSGPPTMPVRAMETLAEHRVPTSVPPAGRPARRRAVIRDAVAAAPGPVRRAPTPPQGSPGMAPPPVAPYRQPSHQVAALACELVPPPDPDPRLFPDLFPDLLNGAHR